MLIAVCLTVFILQSLIQVCPPVEEEIYTDIYIHTYTTIRFYNSKQQMLDTCQRFLITASLQLTV